MKPLKIVPLLACSLLWACQSQEADFPLQEDNSATVVNETAERQITQDVNSAEVDNILDLLFDNKAKSRAADYDIHVIKDSKGNDRIICINFSDNKGYALVSAVKSYEPILAYAETGHFSETDSLPLPVKAWMENTVDEIGESVTLPADSLAKIASKWRQFEAVKPWRMSRSDETDIDLFHIMKSQIDQWVADGYRVYSIDDYNEAIALGDHNAVVEFVQANMYPAYCDNYSNITIVRVKELGTQSGVGHWMNVAWNQEGRFNEVFPLKPENSFDHIPVGCGVLAVGQIMYAYKYPDYFDWIVMPAYEGDTPTSNFLLDVYNKCNAYYDASKEGTACTQSDRIKALKGYGYSCSELNGKDLTEWNLLTNYPSIVASIIKRKDNGKDEDHAWIIEGPKFFETSREIEIWTFTYSDTFTSIYHEDAETQQSRMMYINWGYKNPNYNSYYSFSSMVPKYPDPSKGPQSEYTSNRLTQAIINIRPNK